MLILTGSLSVTAQEFQTDHIILNEKFHLNGGVRASMGGRSRIVVPLPIPVEPSVVYYAFSTSGNPNELKTINLVAQATNFIYPGIGQAAVTALSFVAPQGTGGVVNFYLMPASETQAFLAKTQFRYVMNASRENFREGAICVRNDLRGQEWYLGIMNPSATQSVDVTVDAIAIKAAQ